MLSTITDTHTHDPLSKGLIPLICVQFARSSQESLPEQTHHSICTYCKNEWGGGDKLNLPPLVSHSLQFANEKGQEGAKCFELFLLAKQTQRISPLSFQGCPLFFYSPFYGDELSYAGMGLFCFYCPIHFPPLLSEGMRW